MGGSCLAGLLGVIRFGRPAMAPLGLPEQVSSVQVLLQIIDFILDIVSG